MQMFSFLEIEWTDFIFCFLRHNKCAYNSVGNLLLEVTFWWFLNSCREFEFLNLWRLSFCKKSWMSFEFLWVFSVWVLKKCWKNKPVVVVRGARIVKAISIEINYPPLHANTPFVNLLLSSNHRASSWLIRCVSSV